MQKDLDRLKSLEADVRHTSPKSPMVPYIAYRRLLAEYASQHQASSSTAKQQENQKWWRERIGEVHEGIPSGRRYGRGDAATGDRARIHRPASGRPALVQRSGRPRIRRRRPVIEPIGALRRLDLKGKAFDFSGPALGDGRAINARDYHGKVLLVSYWSTWCTACTQDLPRPPLSF